MWPVQEQINLIYIFNVKLALKVNMNEKKYDSKLSNFIHYCFIFHLRDINLNIFNNLIVLVSGFEFDISHAIIQIII